MNLFSELVITYMHLLLCMYFSIPTNIHRLKDETFLCDVICYNELHYNGNKDNTIIIECNILDTKSMASNYKIFCIFMLPDDCL